MIFDEISIPSLREWTIASRSNDHDKIKYILKAGNQNTCKIIGKYIYLNI